MIDKNIERVVVKDLSKEFCVELRTPKKALEKFVSFFSGKKVIVCKSAYYSY